jgi:hypothetical protein
MSEAAPAPAPKSAEIAVFEVRASAAVNSLLQELANAYGRLADMAGEIAVLRAQNAALQQAKAPAE